MSTGAKVGLYVGIGGGALILVLILVLIIVLAGRGGAGSESSFTLHPGNRHVEVVQFQQGAQAVISVRSDVTDPFTDVDLFVFEGNGLNPVAVDTRISKDCDVRFMVNRTGQYRLEVVNLGPGTARCVLTHNGRR